jgi:hypothetical protein
MLKIIVPTLLSLHFSPIISKHRIGAPLAPKARENPNQNAKITPGRAINHAAKKGAKKLLNALPAFGDSFRGAATRAPAASPG